MKRIFIVLMFMVAVSAFSAEDRFETIYYGDIVVEYGSFSSEVKSIEYPSDLLVNVSPYYNKIQMHSMLQGLPDNAKVAVIIGRDDVIFELFDSYYILSIGHYSRSISYIGEELPKSLQK